VLLTDNFFINNLFKYLMYLTFPWRIFRRDQTVSRHHKDGCIMAGGYKQSASKLTEVWQKHHIRKVN